MAENDIPFQQANASNKFESMSLPADAAAFKEQLGPMDVPDPILDEFGDPSIAITDRRLLTEGGKEVVQWNNLLLLDANDKWAVEWGGRSLYSAGGNPVYDWNDGKFYWAADFESGVPVVDLLSLSLSDDLGVSLNWADRGLYDSTGDLVLSWNGNIMLSSSDYQTSIDWGYRWLRDEVGSASVNWNARKLYSENGEDSVNWTERRLQDSQGGITVDWENCRLGYNIPGAAYWTLDTDGSGSNYLPIPGLGQMYGNWNFTSLAAGAVNVTNVTMMSAHHESSYLIAPSSDFPAGLIPFAFCSTTGSVQVRLFNASGAPVTYEGGFVIHQVKHPI